MPIEVDGDARRAAVIAAAGDAIVDGGLNAVTFRNLAGRLGCSTTVVSHYFRDKRELLAETYRATIGEATRLRERLATGQDAGPIAALAEMLPIAAPQRRIWTIWLAFWSAALSDDGLRAQHLAGLAGTRGRARDALRAAGLDERAAEAGADDVTDALFGIAVQALFDDRHWTADRQRAAFARAVGRLPG